MTLVRFPGIADFEFAKDGNIGCWAEPEADSRTIEHLVVNQILPLAQSRNEALVLHAGAIAVDDFAVAFIGRSGRGKSTLVTSFATSGQAFLADDAVAIRRDKHWTALPHHPSVRLWEDSARALLPAQQPKGASLPFSDKARFMANSALRFCDEPRPLRCVYVLTSSDELVPSISPLSPGTALVELIKNRFVLDVDKKEVLATNFDQLSKFAQIPMFFSLGFPKSFDAMPAVRTSILAHARDRTLSTAGTRDV